MPEEIVDRKVFSLSEVSRSIKKTLSERYKSTFWVKAEMNKLNFYKYSGHCYPDLLEKENNVVIAQMRAILWNADFQRINQAFLQLLKEPLKDGINILFEASIQYDTIHGISLRIHQIEPAFTLGALELEKKQSIERLQKEGIFGTNKSVSLPILPKRIAVISVETSKGYADFKKVLDNNTAKFGFFIWLFPALLQGEKAVPSIITQLNKIKRLKKHFDAVAIIRGGGGEVGLTCYNDYLLCKTIALFPLPILTGIGHATNETVAEMVSHKNGITPTAIAEFLIRKMDLAAEPVLSATKAISKTSNLLRNEKISLSRNREVLVWASAHLLKERNHSLELLARKMEQSSFQHIQFQKNKLSQTGLNLSQTTFLLQKFQSQIFQQQEKLATFSQHIIYKSKSELNFQEQNLQLLHPREVLKRGYSITLVNGKSITDYQNIKENDEIESILSNGKIISRVLSTKANEDEK